MAVAEQYANEVPNNVVTTLNGSIGSGTSPMTVHGFTGFPASAQYRVRIEDELLIVTGGAGTTSWTVTRGAEGTTAASHPDNATVTHVLTRDGLIAVGGQIILSDLLANQPSAGVTGRLFLPTDGLEVDRDDGSAWAAYGPLWPLTKPPTIANWTWDNQGSATATENGGVIRLSAPAVAGDNFRVLFRTAPSAPYTITAMILPEVNNTSFNNIGIGWRNSSSGKLAFISLLTNGTGDLRVCSRNAATSTSSQSVYADQSGFILHSPLWLRIADNNTNRIVSYSYNGLDFITLHTVTRLDFLTPDQVMFFAESLSTAIYTAVTLVSWKVT